MLAPKSWSERAKYGFILFLFTTLITFCDFLVTLFRSNAISDMKAVTWFYFIPAALGHAALIAVVLYIVYLLIATIFKNNRVPAYIYVVLAILAQVIIVLDGLVFNIYRFHINSFVIDLAFGAGNQIFVFDFWLCVKFTVLAILVSVVPYFIAIKVANRTFMMLKAKSIKWLSIGLLVCLSIAHLGSAYAFGARETHILRSGTVLPWFFPLRANTLMGKMGLLKTDEIDSVSYNIPSSDLNYPLHPIEVADSIPNYNIVHILIDSWNPTVFDSIATPNIYHFSKDKGNYFSQHLSSNDATSGSLFGMFFGITATYDKDFEIANRVPIFLDQLIDRNYNVEVFSSASFTRPPFNRIHFRRFPHINTSTEGDTPFDRDNKLTELAINYFAEQTPDKPFYSFLFYDLAHAISIPKEEYRQKFQPSWPEADYLALNNDLDRTPFFNLYKNCIYHIDGLVGQVLDDLTERGLLENTIIFITGDHGQEFNENKMNYWGHGSNYSNWQLQVPFIIYYPGIEAGKQFDHMTTHYDITPTLLSRFFGVKNPMRDYSMGYDLEDTSNRYPHLVGNYKNYGFVFENMIVDAKVIGSMNITDRNLREIPRSQLKASDLQEAIDKMNIYYKK